MNIYRVLPFMYVSSYMVIMFLMKKIPLDPGVKALVRFSIAFTCLMPLFFVNRATLKTKNHALYIMRASIAACAVILTYIVYNTLPIASATSISLSEPLFTALLSWLVLRERISSSKWVMIVLGYVGVLVSLWPLDFKSKYIYMQGLLLLANVLVSINSVLVKKLSVRDHTTTVMFFLHVYMIPFLIIINLIKGSTITWDIFQWNNLKMLIPIGMLGALNNAIMLISLRKLPVSTFTSSQYFRIFLATAISWYFGESIAVNEMIGGAIILFASIMI